LEVQKLKKDYQHLVNTLPFGAIQFKKSDTREDKSPKVLYDSIVKDLEEDTPSGNATIVQMNPKFLSLFHLQEEQIIDQGMIKNLQLSLTKFK